MSSKYITPEMKFSPVTSPTIIKAEHSRDEAERQFRLGSEEGRYDMAYWAAYIDGARAQLKEDLKLLFPEENA